jgi:hypothetical protein
MRLIGLASAAAMTVMMCSPAAAECYWFKIIIGQQTTGGPGAPKVDAQYDLRAKTFWVAETVKRTGRLTTFCDQGLLVLYEKNPPDDQSPANVATPPQPANDDGVCWLNITDVKVSGTCFRRSSKPVTMEGMIY